MACTCLSLHISLFGNEQLDDIGCAFFFLLCFGTQHVSLKNCKQENQKHHDIYFIGKRDVQDSVGFEEWKTKVRFKSDYVEFDLSAEN